MSYSAVIAIQEARIPELEDQDTLKVMPVPLQKAVKGKSAGQFKRLTRGGKGWEIFAVWGSPEALDQAEEYFGADMIIMCTHAKDGCRAGTMWITTRTEGAVPAPVTIPVEDIVPSTYTKNRVVKEDFTYLDEDQVEQTGKRRVVKPFTYVRGEVKDFQGNITKEGKKDVLFNGNVVATISVDKLEADGTYIYQPDTPVTSERTLVGDPLRSIDSELLSLLPNKVTHDRDGNVLSDLPAFDLSDVPTFFGHGQRAL